MSEQEPIPNLQPPEAIPVPLRFPEEHAAMYLLGNNMGKMATILAFYSYAGHAVTTYALSKRLHEMVGGAGRPLHTTLLDSYCEDALFPAELVEYENPHPHTKAYARTAMRLTEKGLTLGMGIVGAMVPIELETLTTNDEHNKRLPLHTALGRTMLTSAGLHGVPTRMTIFESLVQEPEVSFAELQHKAKLAPHSAVKLMRQLIDLGLVTRKDRYGADRPYDLQPELAAQDIGRPKTPHSKTILETLMQLQARGETRLTGKQIIDKVLEARPDFVWEEVYAIFTQWRFKNKDLLVPVHAGNELIHYSLTDEYRAFIQELVAVKQKLVATGESADAWRQDSWQYAVNLTRRTPENTQILALLLSSIMQIGQQAKPASKPNDSA